MTNESGLRPITMQDVRLAVGEGPLKPADVLAGCNAELTRRKALISPAGEMSGWRLVPTEPTIEMLEALVGYGLTEADDVPGWVEGYTALPAAPRGMEG